MNWVGGSRTRVLIKQERRKQKEYFEKKRLQSKIKLLEVLSPAKNSTVSLDLLNLYIVNQISCKKEIPENVRKPIHVNMNRDIKMPLRRHDLKLPMSPDYIPSKLCLDDTENNIHYQTPGSKEELGSVQSSQIMDSHNMFETEFSRTENCTLSSPSFSAELSSDRHIPKQNFTPQIASCPWKVAYERRQNEQPSNVNYSDSLVSKLNESQGALSPSYKTTEFGTLFASLNSPGNKNFLTERPGIIMDEDFGSMDERRESVFITEKQLMQHNWGENRKVALNCHGDANQPIPSPLAENCDSFVSQNMISLLNIDQQRIQKTFDKCGYDSIGDTCVVPSFGENNSTDKCIRSIFTVPELTFSNSAFNNTSYCEKCQPNKNCQKKHNDNERNHVCVSFEEHCYPACSEKKVSVTHGKRKFENYYQKKITQKKIQKYPVNHMGNHIPLEELHSTQSRDFGVGKIQMKEGGTCSLKDPDSSPSSQSTSYSPRQTDSCFSSSSEMPSEDEAEVLQQTEDSDRRQFIQTKETTENFYINRMLKFPGDMIVKNNAKTHKQNENSDLFSRKNNAVQFSQPQNNSQILQNKTNNNCIAVVARCDAWVQTEHEPAMEEKLDVAVQCDIISKCMCRSDISSLCNVESCNENIKANTTGGQEILKNK